MTLQNIAFIVIKFRRQRCKLAIAFGDLEKKIKQTNQARGLLKNKHTVIQKTATLFVLYSCPLVRYANNGNNNDDCREIRKLIEQIHQRGNADLISYQWNKRKKKYSKNELLEVWMSKDIIITETQLHNHSHRKFSFDKHIYTKFQVCA